MEEIFLKNPILAILLILFLLALLIVLSIFLYLIIKYAILTSIKDAFYILIGQRWKSSDKNGREKWIQKCRLEKIEHNKILKMLALNDPTPSVRRLAVEKITDKNFLESMIRKEKDYSVRMTVYKKLKIEESEAASIDIAKNDSNIKNREVAVNKISDQQVLSKIAASDKDKTICLAALSKISDKGLTANIEELLADIAKKDKDEPVCQAALSKISDNKLLAVVAECTDYNSIRKAAIARITNQEILIELAKKIKQQFEKELAITKNGDILPARVRSFYENVVEKITDQTFFADKSFQFPDTFDIYCRFINDLDFALDYWIGAVRALHNLHDNRVIPYLIELHQKIKYNFGATKISNYYDRLNAVENAFENQGDACLALELPLCSSSIRKILKNIKEMLEKYPKSIAIENLQKLAVLNNVWEAYSYYSDPDIWSSLTFEINSIDCTDIAKQAQNILDEMNIKWKYF